MTAATHFKLPHSLLRHPALQTGQAIATLSDVRLAAHIRFRSAAVTAGRAKPVNVGGAVEIERAVVAFARAPNGGLITTADSVCDGTIE
jgi:hypothetical protein